MNVAPIDYNPASGGVAEIAPCAYCGDQLHRTAGRARLYRFQHPMNGCALEGFRLANTHYDRWNKGAEAALDPHRRIMAALAPSLETKQAFMGEFYFDVEESRHYVPWPTVKEIMKAICAMAGVRPWRESIVDGKNQVGPQP